MQPKKKKEKKKKKKERKKGKEIMNKRKPNLSLLDCGIESKRKRWWIKLCFELLLNDPIGTAFVGIEIFEENLSLKIKCMLAIC